MRGLVRRTTAVLVAVVLTLALSPTTSAFELGDTREARKGRCSGPSAWRLVARVLDADTLVMKFALAGGRAGQKWQIHVGQNGTHAFSVRRESGEGGYVKVRRRLPNADGRDKIVVGASNSVSLETCHGAVVL